MNKNRLIAITIIRNEENNYLHDWLKNIAQIADYHIFLDDASDDTTPEIVARHLESHRGELHRRKTSLFRENEPALRSELWEYTRAVARDGDWILIVDADEFYDDKIIRLKRKLLKNKYPHAEVVKVSCLDMWNQYEYRVDGYWSPAGTAVRIIRYHNVPFGATGTSLHLPPYPASTDITKNQKIFIPIIHTAYLRKSDRIRRYKFYTQNVSQDTDVVSYQHAMSIMSPDIQTRPYFDFISRVRALLCGDKLYFQIYDTLKKYGEK